MSKRRIMGYIATNTRTKEQLPIRRTLYDCVMMIVVNGGRSLEKIARGEVAREAADEARLDVFAFWEIAEATAEIDAPDGKDEEALLMEATALDAWRPTAGAYFFALSSSVFTKFHPFGEYRKKCD